MIFRFSKFWDFASLDSFRDDILLPLASVKARRQKFTSSARFRLPREQEKEFLHQNWWEHSYNVFESWDNERNWFRYLKMVLEVENRSEGGCDSGMTCWRVAGMDPPSPTWKPNSEKFASEFSEIFYRALLVIYSSKKNIVATSELDPDFTDIYNL